MRNIFWTLTFISFFLILGSVGSIELGVVSLSTGFWRAVAALTLTITFWVLAETTEKKGARYVKQKNRHSF